MVYYFELYFYFPLRPQPIPLPLSLFVRARLESDLDVLVSLVKSIPVSSFCPRRCFVHKGKEIE